MKIGTDAVLLGAWTNENPQKILDIGTGSGIIAIMLAQKTTAYIDAIDIDEESVKQAKENIANCKWNDRINVSHISFQDFYRKQDKQYDLIITNPPFFTNSLKSPENLRNIAKHNDSLSFDEIITGVKLLLEENGKFNIVLPYNESIILKEKALINSLYCSKLLYVKPKPDKNCNRVLMQFSLQKEIPLQTDELIIRHEDNSYTEEYISFTKDYYLSF